MPSRYPSRTPESAARQKLYQTKRWKRLRATVLSRYPYCVDCGKAASIADHSHGHGKGWEARFWDESGIVGRCRPCHSVKTSTQEQGRGRHGQGFGHTGPAEQSGGGPVARNNRDGASHREIHGKREANLPQGKPLEAALKLLNSELKI